MVPFLMVIAVGTYIIMAAFLALHAVFIFDFVAADVAANLPLFFLYLWKLGLQVETIEIGSVVVETKFEIHQAGEEAHHGIVLGYFFWAGAGWAVLWHHLIATALITSISVSSMRLGTSAIRTFCFFEPERLSDIDIVKSTVWARVKH